MLLLSIQSRQNPGQIPSISSNYGMTFLRTNRGFSFLAFGLLAAFLVVAPILAASFVKAFYGIEGERMGGSLLGLELKKLDGDRFLFEEQKSYCVFAGYLHCEGICPTTLHNLERKAKEDKRCSWIFISVSPNLDSASLLANRFQGSSITPLMTTLPNLRNHNELFRVRLNSDNLPIDHAPYIIISNGSKVVSRYHISKIDRISGDLNKLKEL